MSGAEAGAGASRRRPRRGRLLVAAPQLEDPNFRRAVVLIVEHDDQGSFGLVLNQPTAVPVEELLETWSEPASSAPPAVVFSGGPVSPEVVIGLGRPAIGERFVPVLGPVGVVDLHERPQGAPALAARIFSGYAGWGPGQLEAELAQGAWFVVPGRPEDLLCADPGGLWRAVLRRQPGQLRLLSAYPEDPEAN
jgi:putative transcriptional regulator